MRTATHLLAMISATLRHWEEARERRERRGADSNPSLGDDFGDFATLGGGEGEKGEKRRDEANTPFNSGSESFYAGNVAEKIDSEKESLESDSVTNLLSSLVKLSSKAIVQDSSFDFLQNLLRNNYGSMRKKPRCEFPALIKLTSCYEEVSSVHVKTASPSLQFSLEQHLNSYQSQTSRSFLENRLLKVLGIDPFAMCYVPSVADTMPSLNPNTILVPERTSACFDNKLSQSPSPSHSRECSDSCLPESFGTRDSSVDVNWHLAELDDPFSLSSARCKNRRVDANLQSVVPHENISSALSDNSASLLLLDFEVQIPISASQCDAGFSSKKADNLDKELNSDIENGAVDAFTKRINSPSPSASTNLNSLQNLFFDCARTEIKDSDFEGLNDKAVDILAKLPNLDFMLESTQLTSAR
eukprot:gene3658-6232_t